MRIVREAPVAIVAAVESRITAAEIDLQTIGEIGQAISALGTVISALALLGVMRSLQFQQRQTRASEEEVVRAMRNDLMLVALENPGFLPLWGFRSSLSAGEMTQHAYLGMVFGYFESALRNGRMAELELERMLSNMFRMDVVREFWMEARMVYIESGDASAVSLARIAERHYRNVAELAEIEASPVGPVRPPISADLEFDTLDVAGLLPVPGKRRRRVLSTCLHLLRISIWLATRARVRRDRRRRPSREGS
ncbi:DUF6082 family protein [Catenuloplanes atrovinosus]|uniref:Uncharacterized protein n=1 Tax=Catenuloplanes atrovinosus TaxID=137266 RepID=A0AAE3YLR0_9ACTN|nr:DUF6082 family protein [Catenuloplanes atrovinosus]MDR7275840.1 hypothetical protein [Catenuloplanes atrovinosus]